MNYKKYKPVQGISMKGKLMLAFIRFLYLIRKGMGRRQWQTIIPKHHENPLKMTLNEVIYMGYKYYYKAIVKAEEGSNLENYFSKQDYNTSTLKNFIPTSTITISCGGDLLPYKDINSKICKHLWDEVGNFFFNSDIVFANLETPIDISKKAVCVPELMVGDMHFNGNEDIFNVFSGMRKFKGYDVLSTANNHSLDMGVDGLLSTMQFLQKKNITYTGSANNINELHQFPIIEKQGIKVAFLAYTFSFNKFQLPEDKEWLCNHIHLNEENPDISLIKEQTKIARERGADIIIASLHMGCAYQAYPSMHTVNNIHHIIKHTGIDAVVASHPHNAQPMEIFEYTMDNDIQTKRKAFIAYSLGDFIGYDIYKWCQLPLMLKLSFTKGTINNIATTLLTGIQLKPAFMHATKKNGHITQLQLIDIIKNKNSFLGNNKSKGQKRQWVDLVHFLNSFIIQPHQQHIIY